MKNFSVNEKCISFQNAQLVTFCLSSFEYIDKSEVQETRHLQDAEFSFEMKRFELNHTAFALCEAEKNA